jgi:putative hydrolases of HD superfamily
MDPQRLARQLAFVVELDRLKSILRRTSLIDRSRRENSAEHSWHLTLMAAVLAEHAAEPIDPARVVTMLLVHDVVEIDAGDTFCYDAGANLDRAERERQAAERLFGLLPADQADGLRALWEEFEAGATADACFAVALDRMQPLLQNFHGGGGSWREHGVRRAEVRARMEPIREALPAAWPVVERIIEAACAEGWIVEDEVAAASAPAA